MKDFYEIGISEEIAKIRFKYFKENQEQVLKAFAEFELRNSENKGLEEDSYEYESEEEYMYDEEFQVLNEDKTKSNKLEIEIKKCKNYSQSTPSIVSTKATSNLNNQNNGSLTRKSQKKSSIDFNLKKQKQTERLMRLEYEQNIRLQNLIKHKEKSEDSPKKSPTKENSKKYNKKMRKIKEKIQEAEHEHENYIKNSLKKFSETEQRVKETVESKLKMYSERKKFMQKNKLQKKQLLDQEKEQQRSENYLNKIIKIQESRKKIENKSINELKTRLAKSQSQQIKAQNKLMQENEKLDKKIEQYSPRIKELKLYVDGVQKNIEKKELNRLIIGTRISRNKFKLVRFS